MRIPLAAVLLVGLLAGCGAGPSDAPSPAVVPPGLPTASAPTVSASTAAPSSASPSPTPTPSRKPDPICMQALIEKRYDGRDLERGRLLRDAGPYKRYAVTYRGDGKTISGIVNIPDGKGPFPVVVLNHGYIDPRTYFSGQGMPREQDRLARRGYVVLHVDYRNHAGSSGGAADTGDVDHALRLPYVVDTINAVKAVKASGWDVVDREHVGWFGRSMGGGVTLRALAVQPGLVDAAAVWASVSSLEAENWARWYADNPERRATNRRIARSYGLPDDSPAFWRAASARPSFDRITEPVLLEHGTADRTCPVRWARATVGALDDAGVDVKADYVRGADHTFEGRDFDRAMERTIDFFDEHLR